MLSTKLGNIRKLIFSHHPLKNSDPLVLYQTLLNLAERLNTISEVGQMAFPLVPQLSLSEQIIQNTDTKILGLYTLGEIVRQPVKLYISSFPLNIHFPKC